MRLTDLKGNVISHFLSWNGKVIIDHPNSSKVNDTTNRTNPEKSKLAFAKLFPRRVFSSWHITSVYQLSYSHGSCTQIHTYLLASLFSSYIYPNSHCGKWGGCICM